MLLHLHIRNYALIQEITFSPGRQLNIITGETGAGKSILLGALNLLLGGRNEGRFLFDESQKCVIEGEFDLGALGLEDLFEEAGLDYEPVSTIRREIAAQGKSRSFINDTPTTQDVVRNIGNRLIDIHSQHDTLLLANADYQLQLIDQFAGAMAQRQQVAHAWQHFQQCRRQLSELEAQARAAQAEYEFNVFQLRELQAAHLKPGEDEELDQELNLLQNAEDIASKLHNAFELLEDGEACVNLQLKQAVRLLEKLQEYGTNFSDLRTRAASALTELQDIGNELFRLSEATESNPERLEAINERISLLFGLQKKHGLHNSTELLEKQDQIAARVQLVDNTTELLEKARATCQQAEREMNQLAEQLSAQRQSAAPAIEEKVMSLLASVGLPNSTFRVEIQPMAAGPTGADQIRFLFSANKGHKAKDLKQVASGGEFSRVMLALKAIMAERSALPTIIFDEIDTGVSGAVALAVARVMQSMAEEHQLISITHLPQIAAAGQHHFFVYKGEAQGRTTSHIKLLQPDDRVTEIAKMLGGDPPGPAAMTNARELLAVAQ